MASTQNSRTSAQVKSEQPVVWQRTHTPLITLEGCLEVIRELDEAGSKTPSVKLALWGAALSPSKELASNGLQARKLALYVENRLPDGSTYEAREQFREWLQQGTGGGIMRDHIIAIFAIEQAELEGKLPEMPQADWSLSRWLAWRNEACKIRGIAEKTASFAGLLLQPMHCPLVPVDRWVMRRLGYDHDTPTKKEYPVVCNQVAEERDRDGHGSLPLGAWHWYKWSEFRQAVGAETLSERPESHRNLSPKWY